MKFLQYWRVLDIFQYNDDFLCIRRMDLKMDDVWGFGLGFIEGFYGFGMVFGIWVEIRPW